MKAQIYKNYQNFKIFFTFFLLWVGVQFGELIEDSVAFFLVLTLGILHGANDILILAKEEQSYQHKIKHVLIYLGIIALAASIYWVSPFLSILLFIGISAYHFGEEHFSNNVQINFYFDTFFYFFYGLLIFLLLFYSSLDEVNGILNELIGIQFRKELLEVALLISIVYLIVCGIYLYQKVKIKASFLVLEVFYLVLLFFIFTTNSLIFSFAIYFILWHSIPSIIGQVFFLTESFSKKSVLFYFKKALLNWGISILGLLILYYFFPTVELFSSILFLLLFAITAPHIWVMYRMKN